MMLDARERLKRRDAHGRGMSKAPRSWPRAEASRAHADIASDTLGSGWDASVLWAAGTGQRMRYGWQLARCLYLPHPWGGPCTSAWATDTMPGDLAPARG